MKACIRALLLASAFVGAVAVATPQVTVPNVVAAADKDELKRAFAHLLGEGVPRDVAKGVVMLKGLADRGVPDAQYELGYLMAEGALVPKDDAQALRWYETAANHGLARAQDALGGRYARGDGYPRDTKKAAHWYRKAAEQGLARAQYNLGALYLESGGKTRDLAQAWSWLAKAAVQGEPSAQYNLGLMYQRGYGVRQDSSRAILLYEASAAQGHAKASINLGQIYLSWVSACLWTCRRRVAGSWWKQWAGIPRPSPTWAYSIRGPASCATSCRPRRGFGWRKRQARAILRSTSRRNEAATSRRWGTKKFSALHRSPKLGLLAKTSRRQPARQ